MLACQWVSLALQRMPLKHQNGNSSKQPSAKETNETEDVASLIECCKITSLCKPSKDSKDASNDKELPSTTSYLIPPYQNTTRCIQTMPTQSITVSPRRQEPNVQRSYIKDMIGSSEGYRSKSRDNIIFMDMIQKSNDEIDKFITRNPRHEFDHLTKTIEELLVSYEKSKRQLIYMKGIVERYRAEFDEQRLNSKTKEVEAIVLINENERLKEEIAELRLHSASHTNKAADRIIPGNNTQQSEANMDRLSVQRASRCVSSVSSTPGTNSISTVIDTFELSKGKHGVLAPLSKPKIYRRSQDSFHSRARQRLEKTTVMSEADVKFKQSLESGRSQSDTCAGPQSTDRSFETESSMSVPDIQIECINFNDEK